MATEKRELDSQNLSVCLVKMCNRIAGETSYVSTGLVPALVLA